MRFDRRLGSSVTETPVKFQSDRTTYIVSSRLREILRQVILSDIETTPSFYDFDSYTIWNVSN